MEVRFEVFGKTRDELIAAAKDKLDEFAPGTEWAVVSLDVEATMETQGGQTLGWKADVTARDADWPR